MKAPNRLAELLGDPSKIRSVRRSGRTGATITFGVKVRDVSNGAAKTTCVRIRTEGPEREEPCGRVHATAAGAARCAKALAAGMRLGEGKSWVEIRPVTKEPR